MSALQCLAKSASIAGAKSNLFGSFFNGSLANVARVAMNMSGAQYNEDEVMRVVTALFLSDSKQDAREAWAVLDRRRTGAVRRSELEDCLCDILGEESRRRIKHLLDRLPSRSAAFSSATEQMVDGPEFIDLLPKLAQLHSDSGSITGYLAHEAVQWFSSAGESAGHAKNALSMLELETLVKVPPPMMARAGAVVERMLDAGYTSAQASTAVEALYGGRDTRRLARLWGLFDTQRKGSISATAFDAALPLLTDAVGPADVPAVRGQMGFVNPDAVAYLEFEAALRLLVPPDGSPPRLGASDQFTAQLTDIFGGSANVSRLKPYQRQRATRLALRMKNFGYTPSAVSALARLTASATQRTNTRRTTGCASSSFSLACFSLVTASLSDLDHVPHALPDETSRQGPLGHLGPAAPQALWRRGGRWRRQGQRRRRRRRRRRGRVGH